MTFAEDHARAVAHNMRFSALADAIRHGEAITARKRRKPLVPSSPDIASTYSKLLDLGFDIQPLDLAPDRIDQLERQGKTMAVIPIADFDPTDFLETI